MVKWCSSDIPRLYSPYVYWCLPQEVIEVMVWLTSFRVKIYFFILQLIDKSITPITRSTWSPYIYWEVPLDKNHLDITPTSLLGYKSHSMCYHYTGVYDYPNKCSYEYRVSNIGKWNHLIGRWDHLVGVCWHMNLFGTIRVALQYQSTISTYSQMFH